MGQVLLVIVAPLPVLNGYIKSDTMAISIMNNHQSKTAFVILAAAVAAVFMSSAVLITAEAQSKKIAELKTKGPKRTRAELIRAAPIAISGNNVYIAWWSNKTGNDEVMFRASTDNGVTFGNKINLSNTTEADSQDAEIAASGNKVYVTWWERNQTSEEPVLRISNNNGGTFGPILKLASNGTIGGGAGG